MRRESFLERRDVLDWGRLGLITTFWLAACLNYFPGDLLLFLILAWIVGIPRSVCLESLVDSEGLVHHEGVRHFLIEFVERVATDIFAFANPL